MTGRRCPPTAAVARQGAASSHAALYRPALDTAVDVRHAAPLAVDTTGEFWRGEDFNDLAGYLREFQAGGYPVARVKELTCSGCAGRTFASKPTTTRGALGRDASPATP